MNNSLSQIYLNLSEEKKQEIHNNLKKHQRMPIGFYSCVYTIEINGQMKKYRFHSSIKNGQPLFSIVFDKNEPIQSTIVNDNVISFYDKELKRALVLDKNICEEQIVKEIDYNLSEEQIELLVVGKEITIDLKSINTSNKELPLYLRNKSKLLSVDYNFFLGKISMFLNQEQLNNIKKHPSLTLNKL